jgi:predicted metal-binding membrane protein
LGVAAALAWGVLLVPGGSQDVTALNHSRSGNGPRESNGTHEEPNAMTVPQRPAGGFALMTVAMMTPATLPAARYVALNSFRRRRLRAMAVYQTAYLAVFVAFGIAAVVVAEPLVAASSARISLLLMLTLCASWQLTKWKRRAILSCRRIEALPPSGLRADVGCARFGLREAARCLASTWPLMLVVALIGHGNLAMMGAVTAVMVVEQRPPLARRLLRPLAVVLLASAVAVALID